MVDRLWLRLHYHWYIQNRRGICMKVLAILFGALSFITVLTEVLFFFGEFEETGLRHYLVDEDHDRTYFAQNVRDFHFYICSSKLFLLQIIYLIPLSYIFWCTFYGLFNFDVLEVLALHWNQSTDPFCLMQSSINTWRLAVPAVYNFLQILSIKKCAFLDVMGPVQEIPFIGHGLNKWVFPSCLSFMVLLTMTDGYNRIARFFGRKGAYISSRDAYTSEKIMDGQFVVEQYRKEKIVNRERLQGQGQSSADLMHS